MRALRRAPEAGALLCAVTGMLLCGVTPLRGQSAPPPTDVYLVPVERSEDGWSFGAPINITDRPGYDNQPAFTGDGRLLYTSYRDGQSDVFVAPFPDGPPERLTRTPESEYSPTPMPDGSFTVVRVEADSAQRLWRFTAEGEPVERLPTGPGQVGYHAWLDSTRVAFYVLGDPPELRLLDTGSGDVRDVSAGVGRSLRPIPDGGISFVRFEGEEGGEAWLHRLGPDGRTVERLARLPGDRQDHAWSPDGSVWVGVAGDLWTWHPERDRGRGFSRVASLGSRGLISITRVAVSPDGRWLAVVARDPVDGG